jgi:hypothetical protein
METKPKFDLTQSLQQWRQELAGQPVITAEKSRELETHLFDTMAELKAHGLNDEESFWLAARRTGVPAQLAPEFAKTDSAATWRKNVLLIAVWLLAWRIWQAYLTVAVGGILEFWRKSPAHFVHHEAIFEGLMKGVPIVFSFIPIGALFFISFRPEVFANNRLLRFGSCSRRHFLALASALYLPAFLAKSYYFFENHFFRSNWADWMNFLGRDVIWIGALILLITRGFCLPNRTVFRR